jgi:hypothetical protein
VAVGDETAATVSSALFVLVAALGVAFVAAGMLPSGTLAASAFAVAAAIAGRSTTARRSVRLQMALTYPFTAVLWLGYCPVVDCVGGQWLRQAPFGGIEQFLG